MLLAALIGKQRMVITAGGIFFSKMIDKGGQPLDIGDKI